jgi:hypothetical protein
MTSLSWVTSGLQEFSQTSGSSPRSDIRHRRQLRACLHRDSRDRQRSRVTRRLQFPYFAVVRSCSSECGCVRSLCVSGLDRAAYSVALQCKRAKNAAILDRSDSVLRDDGVGGSNPSCGTNEINQLSEHAFQHREAMSALCPNRRCRSKQRRRRPSRDVDRDAPRLVGPYLLLPPR